MRSPSIFIEDPFSKKLSFCNKMRVCQVCLGFLTKNVISDSSSRIASLKFGILTIFFILCNGTYTLILSNKHHVFSLKFIGGLILRASFPEIRSNLKCN